MRFYKTSTIKWQIITRGYMKRKQSDSSIICKIVEKTLIFNPYFDVNRFLITLCYFVKNEVS